MTVTITATEPLLDPPAWALLQRELFAVLDAAWRRFEETFCADDGRLLFAGAMASRDGVDDFYEAFGNWPQLYLLGGAEDLLPSSVRHWEAVTAQLTELGMLHGEFDKGYDWFHIGEGLLFFYQLCMSDPRYFADRARRFAELYVDPRYGNYDPDLAMIRAPHNGALGARFGVNDGGPYPWREELAEQYGYPLDWMHDPAEPLPPVADDPRLGPLMHERLGRGDVAVNLAAVALVANAHLVQPEPRYVEWCRRYVDAWRARATANGGLVPDNVGPDGKVGSLLDGRWYGGHYGWSWPHGCYSVGTAVLVGALAAALVTGDDAPLDLPRTLLDTLITQGKTDRTSSSDTSLLERWTAHLGPDVDAETFLVPYRFSDRGWFDFNPVQAALPTALWHETASREDRARLVGLRERAGYDWTRVRPFRDKEEAGHEEPWLAYLAGDNDAYPEQILAVALAQARRRLHLIDNLTDPTAREAQIHRWQRLNPVVTEALVQLTWGAPQVLYNGGLQQARVRYFDLDARRPGLPPSVSALVSGVEPTNTLLQLINHDAVHARKVVVQAGAFAQDVIRAVQVSALAEPWGGAETDYTFEPPRPDRREQAVGSPWLQVDLPAASRISMTLALERNAHPPSYTAPWDIESTGTA